MPCRLGLGGGEVVAGDVDGVGVPAAGDDDQSLAAHVGDEGLVVEDILVLLDRPGRAAVKPISPDAHYGGIRGPVCRISSTSLRRASSSG
jgi:hypothetical protein